jgi:diguanylate cyclase (GGDEF)-like protein
MKILLIEDNSDDALFLQACLSREAAKSIELDRVATMKEAVAAIEQQPFDVILLDLHLPDASGHECVEKVQQANSDTPIVVLSGQGDEDFAVEILNRGVQDYLVKWEGDGKIILRSIRYAIERKRAESRLNYLASYDSLTGIPNRQYFQDHLDRATRRARRARRKLGVLFLDLDRFKAVNDTLGHKAGDELLKIVVTRLRDVIRSGDMLARLGGDEFAVLLEDINGPLELEAAAAKILTAFEETFVLDGRPVSITVSVGISVYPSDNRDPLALLNNADIAMYQAKDFGRNSFKFFTQTMHEEIIRYHLLQDDLKNALDRNEFELVYQPQVNLADRKVHACEALLRWNHPTRGLVGPDEFIPMAEENGYIIPIGLWVLERACRQLQEWKEAGMSPPRLAVNVSPAHFHQADFSRQVEATLLRYSVSPSLIELELTEGSLMKDTDEIQASLERLKDTGVRLAIDDFGTGYSCLSYLQKFAIDVLKIDRSFVSDIGVSEDGQAICSVILSIAKRLGLDSVAEGIETEQQLGFFVGQGCDYAQGYYFGRPMKAADLWRHPIMQTAERVRPNEAFGRSVATGEAS